MPAVKLSQTGHKFQEWIFTHPWIKNLVKLPTEEISLMRPVRQIIPKLTTNDLKNPTRSKRVLKNKTHFAKVMKFYSVHNYKVFACIRDSECQLLVEFHPECVSYFERFHHCRITSGTVNCLFVIGNCDLEYRSVARVNDEFRINILPRKQKLMDQIPVLVINQATVADWGQMEAQTTFPFVHQEV
ncbi:LOW QUALITY PROTEIN: telomerase subunit EST3 KNAG_0L00960 [Huiozyma naganishii CBS 8797]|uniref:Telomere replication protein EST3 n=1 Tax=Huiozyma naganishii (strain ATCC MYA-139 / BCRC 22969 / CBS 8797 / KCTC 17520 / NBRC 10181 / NCYC 3082 / Yp74L-3) TaxID=1071383 RepID=J7RS47_HUIN7|nr:LOW QUALITY PROTEIN: hypothetical protein KNAG_0L00960 [Kazachstania naganishii CBS 8797]CCK72718.1 hypothetical protein KNAG_0L00960 [Kazachstania naganishii CBS 8797]